VKLAGFRRDPAPVYRSADVFAFPSLAEGSALVTYEALASGLPVVTTANAGSVVRDGIEGFIIGAGDAGALAQRLDELHRDPCLREAMGRAARERAAAYTWERYGRAFAQALAALATASPTPS
jgi:glycosyltransferase involved in cell wall biosynthesis